MLLLKRCALFILIAAAVLLTLDPGRLTWVFQHLQPHYPASQGALHTVQEEVDSMLTNALEFLAIDDHKDWNYSTVPEDRGMRIPRILHHIFLDGEEEYFKTTEEATALGSGMKREWRESCIAAHPNWTYMFWDRAAALKLLNNRYPWFTKTFLSYRKVVSQGDALRPFLMHAFGGMYLDLDVSCYKSSEPFLQGHDLVFQSEKNEEDVSNAVVASITGHPFWNAVVRKMIVEAKRANEKVLDSGSILTTTGPNVFKEVFQRWVEYVRPEPPYGGQYMVHGSRVKYYPRGHWFVPCLWDDVACHRGINELAAAGTPNVQLAGHHQFTGSWLGSLNDPTPELARPKGDTNDPSDTMAEAHTKEKRRLKLSLHQNRRQNRSI